MNIHFIQHEVFEVPGAILTWAEKNGYTISFSKVYELQPLPETVENIDMLIIMGGPQSPNTTLEECPHFDAQAEVNLIKKCIEAKKVVFGVCLGAQLIGTAMGADVEHSPEKEIGVFPIQLTEDGLNDKKIEHFGKFLLVGHWHNDMPGITPDSKVLATSLGCPRQIIAYSDLVYGFQCHLELNHKVVKLLIEHDDDILSKSKEYRFVQTPQEILGSDYTEMNNKLFEFLDNLVYAYQQ